MNPFVTACVLLPLVAALQRFAVAYSFEGKAKAAAGREALYVFILLAAVMVAVLFFYWLGVRNDRPGCV